jgi:hypothetical protein
MYRQKKIINIVWIDKYVIGDCFGVIHSALKKRDDSGQ